MGRIQCCSAAFESRAAWDRVLCRATLEPATDQANGVYVWAVVERVSMAILATRTLRQHAVRVDTAAQEIGFSCMGSRRACFHSSDERPTAVSTSPDEVAATQSSVETSEEKSPVSTPVEDPKPAAAEEPKPAAAEEPKPAAAEEPKPAAAEEPKVETKPAPAATSPGSPGSPKTAQQRLNEKRRKQKTGSSKPKQQEAPAAAPKPAAPKSEGSAASCVVS